MSRVLCMNPAFFHVCVLKLWDAVIYVKNDSNETVALTLMMRICCEVLLLIWIIHRFLSETVILMNITLIHVYNHVLPGHIPLHNAPHILVYLLQNVRF